MIEEERFKENICSYKWLIAVQRGGDRGVDRLEFAGFLPSIGGSLGGYDSGNILTRLEKMDYLKKTGPDEEDENLARFTLTEAGNEQAKTWYNYA